LTTTTSLTTEFSDHDSDEPCSEGDDSVEASEILSAIMPKNRASSIPLHGPGYEFRLHQLDEDLLVPDQYLKKLQGLQRIICQNSGIGRQYSQISSEVSSANVAPISQTWDGKSPREKLQACSELIRMIKVNAEVLEESRFCESVTFLCLDQDRPIIAMLRSIKIADLLLLGVIMGAEETPDRNLFTLAGIFLKFSKEFLGDFVDYKNDSFEDGSSYLTLDFVIVCLRILNLVLISHVYAHVGSFDHTITGDLTMQREFHVSKERCVSVETRPNDGQSIILTRRTLRCLSGFLGGEQVWVFHHLGKNVRRDDELFVSATPEDFANAWGPMWKIKKAGDPSVVMRYDLDHGSIVPANLTESLCHFSSATNMRLDEQRCHWISHSQLQNIQKFRDHNVSKQDGISHMTHQNRLLIGACEHTVRRNNVECNCNMAKAKSRFQTQRFIRDLHYVPKQKLRDSIQVGASIGEASTGSICLSYRQTMKNLPGRTAQEAFYKRWVRREIRNWNCLFKYCGLEISICTRNSRRLRFVDLLAGTTLKTALQSLPGYAQEPWREQFECILEQNARDLIRFVTNNPTWRSSIEMYIGYCLEILVETGIGNGAGNGSTERRLSAFWTYGTQEMIVSFPWAYYDWIGFFDFESVCLFVVLEKCLVNKFGRLCCNPTKPALGVKNEERNLPAVLEIFLDVNESDVPLGMRKQERLGGKFWKVDRVDGEKHSFQLDERGRLYGHRCCSNTVLVGKWSPRSRLAATARAFLQNKLGDEKHIHSEHDHDGEEGDIDPLPYLIQETPK